MGRRQAPVAPGDLAEVTIDSLEPRGSGVGRIDGFVAFVRRGLPGDRVRARIGKVRRSHAEAVVEEVLEAGPGRISPECRFHDRCGGCAWQALDYSRQLAAKEGHVGELLQRIAGIDPGGIVRPIVGATSTFGYRNKMEYTFVPEIGDDGEPRVGLGFHMLGRWDRLVSVDPCLIADPRGLPAVDAVRRWANEYDLRALGVVERDPRPGDEEDGPRDKDAILRTLTVRVGRATGDVMVHLTSTATRLPRAAELVDELEASVEGLVSVLHTPNTDPNDSMPREDPLVLWGDETFSEQIGDVLVRVRPNSFLQPNTEMAEQLYALVVDAADIGPEDVVWDIYSGIGSISSWLAKRARHVVGIEVVDEAVLSARENTAANGLLNCEFHAGNARVVLKFLPESVPAPDIVVVDPPRAGVAPKVIRRLCEREPRRIVYVSCNPATWAADLNRFAEHGWHLRWAQPVDQFPHTPHVELVSVLEPS